MFVTPLDQVGQCSDGTLTVRFRCSVGIGAGKWTLPTPENPVETYAELDITPTLRLGHNVETEPTTATHALECSATETIIRATVESIDDDGMAYVRLADDCLIMAESVVGELFKGMTINIRLAHEELVVG